MICAECKTEVPALHADGLGDCCHVAESVGKKRGRPKKYKKHATQAPPKHDRVCPECGEEFKAHYGMKRYCSESCQKTARNRRYHRSTFYVIECDGLFYRGDCAKGGERWQKRSLARVYQTKPKARMALKRIGKGEIRTVKKPAEKPCA